MSIGISGYERPEFYSFPSIFLFSRGKVSAANTGIIPILVYFEKNYMNSVFRKHVD